MINVIFNKSDYEITQRKIEMFEKFNKVIQWGRRNPVLFMEKFFGLQFTDHQRYVLLSTWNTRYAVWLMSRNSGKACDENTKIWLPDGEYKLMKDVHTGDYVVGVDYKPTQVIGESEIFFNDTYDVYFSDGDKITVSDNHTWWIGIGTIDSFILCQTKDLYDIIKKEPFVFNIDKKRIIGVEKTKVVPTKCIEVDNDTHTYLCGEKKTATHNSYLSAPYMMARSILIPNHESYIMCPSGNQAQQTFSKIEDLAKNKVSSVQGATAVFLGELMKANAGNDGFVHDKHSHYCELFNGSSIHTLNSIAKNVVGIRSNLNFYDEAGKVERDFFDLTEPFCTQDRDFITGANFNINCMPKQMPNQIIYASSAEGIDSRLYDMYKECALRMIGGNMDYFCCDVTCELSLHPNMDGKPYKPLLSQEVIDNALKMNEFRANREYFNKFDLSGGQDALVKRSTIFANSYGYHPIYYNDTNERKFIIAYDPATKIDNSMVGIAELIEDFEKGLMLKMANLINLIDLLPNGDKKVVQKPEQVERIKKLLLAYNGKVLDYDNIIRLLIDAGSGGGGFETAQYLLQDWKGPDGKTHLGLIDMEDKYLKLERDKFPGACDKLTMANFTGKKVEMYQACQDMINQGLVMFPKSLNLRLEMEFEEIDSEGNLQIICERMNSEEIATLVEFDMMKEELVAMQKTKQGSTVKFDLLPSKKLENMHDDRSDVCAMLCWQLYLLRKDDILYVDRKTDGFSKLFKHGLPSQANRFSSGKINPFLNSGKNPFI